MSDRPPYGSSPLRHSDEDLLDSDDDHQDIPERCLIVPEIWKDQEGEALNTGVKQENGPHALVRNRQSSTASNNDLELSWNWPSTGYSSLKQWASSNNSTSFPIINIPSKAVPNNDALLSSYMLRASPEETDLAWMNGGSVSRNDEKSFGDFSREMYPRNKLSSSEGHQKRRSSGKRSTKMGGSPLRGPAEDLFRSAKSVLDGGYNKIKQEDMELNDNEHLSCHVCSFVGTSEDDFREHMSIHFRQRCALCDYTCRTAGRLRRHTKEYHHHDHSPSTSTVSTSNPGGAVRDAGLRKNYHCRHCSYFTVERDSYWEHKMVHIPIARQLRCPYECKFVTDLKHHLVYHLSNHSGEKPYRCDRCAYDCINKSMLNSHMKSHSNYYPYRCFHCSFASKYPHPMKMHEKKRGHKRIQLKPNPKKVPLSRMTDIESGIPPVKFESSESGVVELISPIGNSRVPFKKRNHKRIKQSSQFQSQPPIPPNLIQNFTQYPMAFTPPGGYYFPGFLPTNGWMFPPFAARLPFVGGLPQMSAMNESWFARKALMSNEKDSSQGTSNLSAASPMKSVGYDINSVQLNLLQSMNLIQSNVLFNYSRNYAGGDRGGGGGGQMFTQPFKCSLCYFVTSTAVALLQHTMIAHTVTSLSNAHSSLNGFLETGRPLSQSTPMKLSDSAGARTTDSLKSASATKDKSTPGGYAASSATFPRVDTSAAYAQTQQEEYNRMLTNEITASIDRERKKRNGDFQREGRLADFAASTSYQALKLECADNGEIEKRDADVQFLSMGSQSRLSNASPSDDDIATVSYTPTKYTISKLDVISSRLQSLQQGSASSQGYHTSTLSGSSTKETSASSASWPMGSPISPPEIGKLQPAHSGWKSKGLSEESVEEPEDLSLIGRGRIQDQTHTPTGSNPPGLSAIRSLNEQFRVTNGLTEPRSVSNNN